MTRCSLTLAAWVLALTGIANADPVPDQGTWVAALQARHLDGDGIVDAWYDRDRDVTWLAQANPFGDAPWDQAMAGVSALTVAGVGGWRLPTLAGTPTCDDGYSFDGSGWCGYNVDPGPSELAYFFQVLLGNKPYYDTAGVGPQPGWGLTNTGPFENLLEGEYWTDVTYPDAAYTDYAWLYFAGWGYQDAGEKHLPLGVLVLRDGDVAPVPEPGPLALWLAGLGALGWRVRRRSRCLPPARPEGGAVAAAARTSPARPLAAAALLVACGAAPAAPVGFEFTLPDWEIRNAAGQLLYGSNATLRVTVDNGSASTAQQAYGFGDILEVFVRSGSYANTWLANDAYIVTDPDYAILFTDAAGIPSLDLTPEPDPGQRIVFSNAAGTWAFGLGRSDNGSFTAVWLEDGPQFTGDARAFNSDYGDVVVVGSVVGAHELPLPSTGVLAALGLAGLAGVRRRRFVGQTAT